MMLESSTFFMHPHHVQYLRDEILVQMSTSSIEPVVCSYSKRGYGILALCFTVTDVPSVIFVQLVATEGCLLLALPNAFSYVIPLTRHGEVDRRANTERVRLRITVN